MSVTVGPGASLTQGDAGATPQQHLITVVLSPFSVRRWARPVGSTRCPQATSAPAPAAKVNARSLESVTSSPSCY